MCFIWKKFKDDLERNIKNVFSKSILCSSIKRNNLSTYERNKITMIESGKKFHT